MVYTNRGLVVSGKRATLVEPVRCVETAPLSTRGGVTHYAIIAGVQGKCLDAVIG